MELEELPVRTRRRRRRRGVPRGICLLAAAALLAGAFQIGRMVGRSEAGRQADHVSAPEWVTVDLLPLNEWSRPGTPLEQVNGIVIHYVGNPNTTAEQNHSYFANLAETHETYASSHFLIGMDGTILQNVPLDEWAYCSNQRNEDTISIECCHPDEEGAFTQDTYDALVKFTRWLMETYELEREDVIRHYDVTGKECPRYFVAHPEEWEAFLDRLSPA